MATRSTDREQEISSRILRHWHEAVPNDRLAHLVKHTSRGFVRSLQVRLAEHGVSMGHWGFLRILWERDGVTQRELSMEAGVMDPTTLIALRGMEKQGYITRERAEGNRKNSYVYLTPAGKALKRVLVPLAEEVNAVATQGMTPSEIAALRKALLHVMGNLARDEALVAPEEAPASQAQPPAARTVRARRKPAP